MLLLNDRDMVLALAVEHGWMKQFEEMARSG